MNWEFAHRLLQFVAAASRPLRVEELAELYAFDFKTGSIPRFQENQRLKDPLHMILSTCSSLLAIADGGDCLGKVIQFSHFSVKEFLMSARLAKTSDITFRRYHVSMTPAHTLAAQACLGILLHLDKDAITRDSLTKWSLAEYAAVHWADHARIEDVSRNVEDGMKQLLDPSKPHFAVCVWIHDPVPSYDAFPWLRARPERPSPPLQTSLQHAAALGLDSIVEFLITELSQNVRSESFIGRGTPLHLALLYGHMETARTLIEHGADVSAPNKGGCTLLHLASRRGRAESIRMLIEHGADGSAQNKEGQTPLHLALQWGQIEVTLMLIEYSADVSAQDKDGRTPLHLASQLGQVEVICMLIERGADVSAQDKDEEIPLHFAGQVGVTRLLIEHGADISAPNKDRQTPLHLALHRGRVEVARMLIEYGADLTVQDKDGQTPLHLASRLVQVEIICMLIERGADVMAQNKDGRTPLHLVLHRGQIDVICMLIERCTDVSAPNKDGETLLHLASQWGQVEVARVLIEHGADVSIQNKDGWTPLHQSLHEGRVEIARMLIEGGADLTSKNGKGDTPLHLVSTQTWPWKAQDCAMVADILLKHGADVNSRNKDGLTPFRLASQVRLPEVTRVLLEHGADPDELPASESPPVTGPVHTVVDLPIPTHPLITTPSVNTSSDLKPPSLNDMLTLDRHRPPVFFTRRLLCSLGIAAIAVALSYFYEVPHRR